MTISIAVLCSGGGRTAINLLDHIHEGHLEAEIVLAIASKHGIAAIDLLTERNVEVAIARQPEDSIAIGDANVEVWLDEYKPDLICLCGYLRLIHIKPWMEGRVLNIHPSLLPKYGGKGMYGTSVHEAVKQNNEVETGCTVHFVDSEYDHGPHVLQKSCSVAQSDSIEGIAEKVFKLECEAYPEAIRQVVEQLRV